MGQGKGRSGLAFALLIHLSLLLNDLMGLDNNKKSQGSESSYTLVAGGASASGEGNQMAEKTRIQTSFFK
jgi:hypothetical protein